MKRTSLLALFLVVASFASAQSSPFLPEDTYQKLVNEISGDNAYDHLRDLTKFHSPAGVDRDFKRAAAWIADKAKEAGLEDVHYIEMPSKRVPWSPISAEAWLIEEKDGKKIETKLGSYKEVATVIADNSRPVDTEAELLDVGAGTNESDYTGKDVKGKILLASGSPSEVEKLGVWKKGAIGILSYATSRVNPIDFPDQIAWQRVNSKADKETGKEPSFAFVVSYRRGLEIKDKFTAHGISNQPGMGGVDTKTAVSAPRVRVKIESEILPQSTHGIVEGWIKGSKNHDQQVVLTAHIQEERFSANDDRSGCANVLEIARALTTLIKQGKLQRPERDIRFWWVNEIDGPYTYFALNPDERKKIWVDINQDMVGTNNKVGMHSRIQHVSRTPWSRPTFFNDVMESIITSLYYGNNAYITAKQSAGVVSASDWYSRPIYSNLGTRDRYSVEIISHMNNTDHMVFDDNWVAATHGGITFTNWPDDYIHSSDDDMWQMDRTTFKRNAVAVTAMALFMANAGEKDVPALQNAVVTGAISRIQGRVRNVVNVREGLQDEGWDIRNVYEKSRILEREAYRSIATVAPFPKQPKTSDDPEQLILSTPLAVVDMKSSGTRHSLQEAMSKKMVDPVDIKTYRDKIDDVKPVPGLHPVMRYEALNFASGKRSVWDIYEWTRAEALGTGEWTYGKVTPEMIQQLFDNAAAAGIVTITELKPPASAPAKKK